MTDDMRDIWGMAHVSCKLPSLAGATCKEVLPHALDIQIGSIPPHTGHTGNASL